MSDEAPDHLTYLDTAHLHAAFQALRSARGGGAPTNARRVLILVLGYLDPETARVCLTRGQMAALLGLGEHAVTVAISALVSIGVLRRERIAKRPARGAAATRYHFNPHVAWSGPHEARARWLAEIPPPGARRHAPETAQ